MEIVKNNVLVDELVGYIAEVAQIKSFKAIETKENFFKFEVTLKVGALHNNQNVKFCIDYHCLITDVKLKNVAMMNCSTFSKISLIIEKALEIRKQCGFIDSRSKF